MAQQTLAGNETRQSRGLEQFCSSLEERPGLAILDLAPANQATVSFITNYGHRLYAGDFQHQLDTIFGSEGDFFENQANPLLASQFLDQAMNFEEGSFDGALVWDALQYIAPPLLQTVVTRLHRLLRPDANLFALFNADERATVIPTYSYRVQDHHTIQMSAKPPRKPAQIFNNRSLEKLFQDFASVKFFLTRDNLRELIVRR